MFVLSCNCEAAIAQAFSWKVKTSMPVTGGTGRNMPLCLTIGSKIYVGGGNIAPGGTGSNEFYEYDTATNAWTKKADLPGATDRSAGVAFAIGGKAYVGLGVSGYFGVGATYLDDLWEYDPATNVWTAKASLPDTGRGGGISCFVVGGKAYVVGGQVLSSGLKTNEVYEYNPATNVWTAKAPFPATNVTYPFAFSSATKGYISAGAQSTAGSKKTYEYDPVANSWTAKADYPGGHTSSGVAFVLNNKAYCGLAGDDTMYTYDITANTWGAAANTSFPGPHRAYAVSAVVGNKVYLGCGWNFNSSTSTQTFYSDWYRVADTTVTTTGIFEESQQEHLSVYPNPSDGTLNISAGNTSISTGALALFNLVGRQLIATNWKKGIPVDISMLPPAQYIARITVDDRVYYEKIVKVQ